jgi:RNA polymerase sigma factor (sigma-70 family)
MNGAMRAAPDSDLWTRAADGDAAAFGALFERHAKAVYNFCFRRTGDWSAAEDLTSVVFLESWRRRRHVRLAGESALPWLLGVATNVVRTRRRAERRHCAALARLPLERGGAFADDVDGRLDDERRMRALLARVGTLPRREQEVLALCVWAELSYEDAAVALGVPVGTIRSRLSRAKARLRELDRRAGHVWDGEHAVPTEVLDG